MNRVDPTIEVSKDKTAGIGLANTQRRLELLYPDRHQFSIENKNGYYVSRLMIRY